MSRFVVLRHDSPHGLHWDLMLETGAVLATWALAEEPRPGGTCPAEGLADHRLAYLDYEGPISAGRGHVTRWDAGLYTVHEQGPTQLALTMSGARLQGRATLTRSAEASAVWQFCWEH
jgi:hypothetical protein